MQSIFSKEVIIGVDELRNSNSGGAGNDSGQRIRKQIDICLDAIEDAFKGGSSRRTPHISARNKVEESPIVEISENIHRVDNKLLLDYLTAISG